MAAFGAAFCLLVCSDELVASGVVSVTDFSQFAAKCVLVCLFFAAEGGQVFVTITQFGVDIAQQDNRVAGDHGGSFQKMRMENVKSRSRRDRQFSAQRNQTARVTLPERRQR